MHVVSEVEDVLKLEVVGISSYDELQTIAILGADDIECLVDVIKQQALLP